MEEEVTQLEEVQLEKVNQLEEIISFETPSNMITRKLREEGYEVAGYMGVKLNKQKSPPSNMVGILKERESVQRSFLGLIKYNKKQRAFHLGTIRINHKEWVLKINKSKYESKLTEVVKNISSSYGAKLQITPSSNKPGRETYLHEL